MGSPRTCDHYKNALFNATCRSSLKKFFAIVLGTSSLKKGTVDVLLNSVSVKFDAMLISYTWLTNDVTPLHFDSYECRQVTRNNKGRGGGAIHVREDLPCEVLEDFFFYQR